MCLKVRKEVFTDWKKKIAKHIYSIYRMFQVFAIFGTRASTMYANQGAGFSSVGSDALALELVMS